MRVMTLQQIFFLPALLLLVFFNCQSADASAPVTKRSWQPSCSPWMSWSSCSKTCGNGIQTRRRYCSRPSSLSSVQRNSCCLKSCPSIVVTYCQSFQSCTYKHVEHIHYKKCGFLWTKRCVTHKTYSMKPYCTTRYRVGQRLQTGERCNHGISDNYNGRDGMMYR